MRNYEIYTAATIVTGISILLLAVQPFVMGVTIVIETVKYSGWGFENSGSTWLYTLFDIVSKMIIGTFLIRKPKKVLKWLRVDTESKRQIVVQFTKFDVIEITIVLLSLYLIIIPLPWFVASWIDYWYLPQLDSFGENTKEIYYIEYLVKAVIGIFLLINSRNFAKKIVKRGQKDDALDAGHS